MKIHMIRLIVGCSLAMNIHGTFAQSLQKKYSDGLKIYMNDDSTRYVKATGLAQIWMRYNDNNPGSAIQSTPVDNTFDVGIRRARFQIMSQINKRVFLYTQVGVNNLNSVSARKTGLFFHDVTGELKIYKNFFTLGGGLSGWNGTARYASSGVGNILGMDLPVVQEPTNDVNDQFVRKFGVFAKGKVNRLDYRFAVANPFPVQSALSPVAGLTVNNQAAYSTTAPKLSYQGYAMWQFLESESNLLPYMTGSYLGKKKVLNVGAGFNLQKDAMWFRNDAGDTISKPMQQFGVDIFYDSYLDAKKQNAITAYASFLNYYFGPNYIRNAGPMNPTTGTIGSASFNGAGNAFPLYGTGQVVYAQVGYLFRKNLLGEHGTLQPYVSGIYANYQRLANPVRVFDLGVNWLISGQNAKLSLDYQSRPIYYADGQGVISESKSARRGQVVLQYQMLF